MIGEMTIRTNGMKTMESRLTDLEIKISFTEDMVEELNHTVFRQQQQIDLLLLQIKALGEQVRTTEPAEPRNLRDEIPPHY
ncbi:MAG: SlyX family protein [Azonexus sp.]|nr:SlyX family protein [Azonexus sp.]